MAPVKTATFDLGEGRSVSGTVGGDIALYFCRPNGKVFDIVPGLHSPYETTALIKQALNFYNKTNATEQAILEYHKNKLEDLDKRKAGVLTNEEIELIKKRRALYKYYGDESTKVIREMSFSKFRETKSPEPLVITEPGGIEYYRRQVHTAMSKEPLKFHTEWKEFVFTKVLEQELVGGVYKFGNAPVPFSMGDE